MFDPVGREARDEFIELYNSHHEQPIDLRYVRIGDQVIQEPLKFDSTSSRLEPGQFAVIFDLDYAPVGGLYEGLIPDSALVLYVNDKTLGSGGLSNSQAETILLIDANGDTLDAYRYTLDNEPGYSDECVNPGVPASETVWGNSLVLNGTPGRVNSSAQQMYRVNLGLSFRDDESNIPRMGSPVFVEVSVENTGALDLIKLHISTSINDSLQLQTQMIDRLKVNEIQSIDTIWTPTRAGMNKITVDVSSPAFAMQKSWDVWVEWPAKSIVINEVMFAPVSGEPEWLEIFNRSTFSVSLNGLKIRDASGRQGLLQGAEPQILQPQAFAVFTADSIIRSLYSIAPDADIFQLKGFPALNNSGETIALLGRSGLSIDSIAIATPAKNGVSLERVNADSGSIRSQNWRNCVAEAGATPASVNSVSPVEFDLAIDTLNVNWYPVIPQRNSPLAIEIPIYNAGKKTISLKSWQLTDLRDGFLYAYSDEQVNLQPGSNIAVNINFTPLVSGEAQFQFNASAIHDLRQENNTLDFTIYVSFNRRDVVFSEIMAAPIDGDPEWVEVINRSEQKINLQNWQFSDPTTSGVLQSGDVNYTLPSNGFAILSESALPGQTLPVPQFLFDKWPNLNNDGDRITLKDPNGVTIDSLDFALNSTAARGVSFENMNPYLNQPAQNTWSYCVAEAGATPGSRNSLYVPALPENGNLVVAPNPFSPDGDGIDDHVLIRYSLPLQTSRVNLFIFNIRGQQVRQLLNNASSGPIRSVIWDGRDGNGHILEIGIYIIYIQALNSLDGELVRLKKPVILAKKL